MAPGVGASGFVGIAPEVTPGTYVAPTKYLVLTEESLQFQQATKWRRPLRGIADVAGGLAGNSHVAGDLSVEITHDTLPWLLLAARGATVAQTDIPAPPLFTYTFTPNAVAVPTATLSITIVRNGVVFGYTGCVVSSQSYSIEEGTLMGTFGIVGRDEAVQSSPTPVHTTVVPYGAGQYELEIPTATQVFDTDSFEFSIDDAAEPQFRIADTRSAQFIKYGERDVTLSVERDFETRTDYDAFKALTAQGVTLKAGHNLGAQADITFEILSAIKNTYEVTGLSGQAELVRASIEYQGVYNAAGSASYGIEIITTEDLGL
jgi:hypothetical protein